MTATETLAILALCGGAGMIGQGIRAVIGLHKAGYLNLDGNTDRAEFNAGYFMQALILSKAH